MAGMCSEIVRNSSLLPSQILLNDSLELQTATETAVFCFRQVLTYAKLALNFQE